MNTTRTIPFVGALGIAAATMAGCSVETTGSNTDNLTGDQCATAYVDAGGICRKANGQFAKKACCEDACATAYLDSHGICRKANGHFAKKACCEQGGDTCSVDTFDQIPAATGYGPACDAIVGAIISAPVTSRSQTYATASERCDLSPLASRSWAYYRSYWVDIYQWGDWDELTGGNDVALDVHEVVHGDLGTVVYIDMDADEDGVYFVYDNNDELLMYLHYEQSSEAFWRCAGGNLDPQNAPDPECVQMGIAWGEHATTFALSGTTTVGGAGDQASPLVAAAISRHAGDNGLADSATVGYEAEAWDNAEWGPGAAVTVTGAGTAAMTYFVADDSWTVVVMSKPEGGDYSFVCSYE